MDAIQVCKYCEKAIVWVAKRFSFWGDRSENPEENEYTAMEMSIKYFSRKKYSLSQYPSCKFNYINFISICR